MKTLKNGPQKLLIIGPKLFFHKYSAAAQNSPELIIHIINMSQDSSVSLSVDEILKTVKKWFLVLKIRYLTSEVVVTAQCSVHSLIVNKACTNSLHIKDPYLL